MTIKINYKSSISKKVSTNTVLFVDEKFNISALKKHVSNDEYSYISDLIKTCDLKKKYFLLKLIQKKLSF